MTIYIASAASTYFEIVLKEKENILRKINARLFILGVILEDNPIFLLPNIFNVPLAYNAVIQFLINMIFPF